MRHFLIALAILLASCSCFAEEIQVPIPKTIRIYNKDQVSCFWCSIEMAGRWIGETELSGMTNQYTGMATPDDVLRFLRRKNISYKLSVGSKKPEIIFDYLIIPCKFEGRGVIVGIDGCHIVNLVHYDPDTKKVFVLDSSDSELRIQKWSWNEFHRRWDGLALVLYGRNDRLPRAC